MKPVAFDYVCPASLPEALKALSHGDGSAKAVAGCQSLGPMLNLRLARPKLLVDISGLPELREVEDHGGFWRVGAGITHAEIEDGVTALGSEGLLPTVARSIAYRAVRNRGTIGGSLAHADPAADWPLVLSAIDARINLEGANGSKQVVCAEFMLAAFTTVLSDDEVITSIDIPKYDSGMRWGYFKFRRKVGEFPIASAIVTSDPKRGNRVLLGALGGPPRFLAIGEGGVKVLTDDTINRLVADATPDLDALDRQIFAGCLSRAVNQAIAQ
ncbi:MAG: FAD binding domain-containing protein [Microvirga sp.]